MAHKAKPKSKRPPRSAETRKAISEAQVKRWAEYQKQKIKDSNRPSAEELLDEIRRKTAVIRIPARPKPPKTS